MFYSTLLALQLRRCNSGLDRRQGFDSLGGQIFCSQPIQASSHWLTAKILLALASTVLLDSDGSADRLVSYISLGLFTRCCMILCARLSIHLDEVPKVQLPWISSWAVIQISNFMFYTTLSLIFYFTTTVLQYQAWCYRLKTHWTLGQSVLYYIQYVYGAELNRHWPGSDVTLASCWTTAERTMISITRNLSGPSCDRELRMSLLFHRHLEQLIVLTRPLTLHFMWASCFSFVILRIKRIAASYTITACVQLVTYCDVLPKKPVYSEARC
jgi:hypothetical protein